jgi:hypothetical protein
MIKRYDEDAYETEVNNMVRRLTDHFDDNLRMWQTRANFLYYFDDNLRVCKNDKSWAPFLQIWTILDDLLPFLKMDLLRILRKCHPPRCCTLVRGVNDAVTENPTFIFILTLTLAIQKQRALMGAL